MAKSTRVPQTGRLMSLRLAQGIIVAPAVNVNLAAARWVYVLGRRFVPEEVRRATRAATPVNKWRAPGMVQARHPPFFL
jgi:hypothetical protein